MSVESEQKILSAPQGSLNQREPRVLFYQSNYTLYQTLFIKPRLKPEIRTKQLMSVNVPSIVKGV